MHISENILSPSGNITERPSKPHSA